MRRVDGTVLSCEASFEGSALSWGFERGRTYNRRADIHARYGGQQQGGIVTPKDHNLVIIITGEAGHAHGYSDRYRADGVFEYFGEGQVGDMAMIRGNRAILDHSSNGKDLLLFRKTQEGLRFEGQLVCEGHHLEQAPDTEGTMRNAIVFELRPLEQVQEAPDADPGDEAGRPLDELRSSALAAARAEPKRGQKLATIFERAAAVKSYVFARASGRCEGCNAAAPFLTARGRPYLEAHHIRRMTDGGPDDPRFMIALCPNCHRQAHYGQDAKVKNEKLQNIVRTLESRIEHEAELQ